MEDTNPTEPIDVTNYPERPSHKKGKTANVYDKTLCNDNKPLIDFINKCIFLDPTIEMERIINIVLLPAYCNADNEYKKSDKFKKVITKAFQRLENDPDRKYNHICGVFETLKVHKNTLTKNKRGDVLTSSVSANNTEWRKRGKVSLKKPELDVIDLDCDDDNGEITAVDNAEVGTENNDLVNGNTIEIQDIQQLITIDEKLKSNDKTNVNNFAVNTPSVAPVNRPVFDKNTKLHVKTPQKKKRVNLITLSNTVSAKTNADSKKRANCNKEYGKVSPKKPKLDVIKLDSDDDNSETADYEVNDNAIEIQDRQEFRTRGEMQTGANTNYNDLLVNTPMSAKVDSLLTENNDNIIEIQDSQEFKIAEDIQNANIRKTKTSYTNSVDNETEEDKENFKDTDSSIDSGNKLLVPQLVQVEKEQKDLDEAEKARKIIQIEASIAKYKKKISELELAEVDNDTEGSPYVQCSRLEARIVKLYNDLCELVDAEPAKGREVRLRVSEGHPEGPIRRLEAFLNEKVDEEGVAPFPDFIDVVTCVKKANKEDGLGWSKSQVMTQAKEIFIYCGRALQKRRQLREYKHMRSRVPREAFDEDPAERDAELMAKLELNKKLARKKEKKILKRHCRMQKDLMKMDVQTADETRVTSCFSVSRENIDSSSDDEQTARPGPSNKPMDRPTEETSIVEQKSGNNVNHETCLDGIIVKIKKEPIEMPVNIQYKGDISLIIEISDSEISDDEDNELNQGASSVRL